MGNGGAFTAHISTVASLAVAERFHFSIQCQIRRQAMKIILFPRVSLFFHGNVAWMSMSRKRKSYSTSKILKLIVLIYHAIHIEQRESTLSTDKNAYLYFKVEKVIKHTIFFFSREWHGFTKRTRSMSLQRKL